MEDVTHHRKEEGCGEGGTDERVDVLKVSDVVVVPPDTEVKL